MDLVHNVKREVLQSCYIRFTCKIDGGQYGRKKEKPQAQGLKLNNIILFNILIMRF